MLHWSDIRGHTRPLDILERALDTGRVHHAYLFSGLEGVGKFLTAQTFAAVVNCRQRPDGRFADACGECGSCRKIARAQHPDMLVVRPDTRTIKIDQIRQVQQASTRAPHQARFRFVLIDDAHALTEPAANALLKTLEEPSSRTRLILVTDQPQTLLDTIISRCQLLRFGTLPDDAVVELLGQQLAERDDGDAPADAQTLAVAAGYGEGSVGRALEIVESNMLDARVELIEEVLTLPAGQALPLLNLAETLSSDRQQLDARLDVIKLFLRDVMLFQAIGPSQRLIDPAMGQLVETFAGRIGTDELLELIEHIRRAQRLLARHVHARLITEELLGALRGQSHR